MGKHISFDNRKCINCKACEIACVEAHKKIKKPFIKISDKDYNLKMSVCINCNFARCEEVCLMKCISYKNGVVVFDNNKCIGCKLCILECPQKAIMMVPVENSFQKDCKNVMQISKCDLCKDKNHKPACVKACPTKALVYMEE